MYRIREKSTGKFISMGYKPKSRWIYFPTQAIETLKRIYGNVDLYEVVKYKEVEVNTFPIE